MRRLALVLIVLLSSCGKPDWTMYKGDFFDITIPPGFTMTTSNKHLVKYENGNDSIILTWSQDQYSIKGQPAHEAVEVNPGDKILVSEEQIFGNCKIWYTEIQCRDGKWQVFLTLPLDRGELRIAAVSQKDIFDIRQSVRSVVITHETYFSYPV